MKKELPAINTFVIILSLLFFVSACKKVDNLPDALPPNEQAKVINGAKDILLGKKLKGEPFSVQNMQNALSNLQSRHQKSGFRTASDPLQPTHNYYKITPHSDDEVIQLDTLGYEIWDVPLDQEIINEGDYYQDPSLPDDHITYLYTALPVGLSLPANIDAQLLQQLYLFSDADGDAYDGEDQDPWDPNNYHCYTYDSNGQPMYEIVCDENYTGCFDCPFRSAARSRDKRPNRIKEATAYLKSIGIKPKDLFNEAMKISGNEDEMIIDKTAGKTTSAGSSNTRRYRPAGHLSVNDNSASSNINLKGVTVKTRRWFNLHNTTTDGNGNFVINGTYGKKATVIVKFKNDFATIRGINGLLKVWQYIFPVKRNIGQYTSTDMENINVVIPNNNIASSTAAMQWVAATAMNNNWEMRANCVATGIPLPPAHLRIWVSSAITTDASAPMLRYIANTSLALQVITQFLGPVSQALVHIVQELAPDITCRYGRSHGQPLTSMELNNAFFHEQAHAVHYTQVGNNYWVNEIIYTVLHNGYGNKTDDGAERAAVVEAWGFFIGNTFTAAKYDPLNANISLNERQQLENQTPDDNISVQFSGNTSRGWIPFGMLHDMTDPTEPAATGVNDNVNAYSIQQIFRGLQPNVNTVQEFRNEVLNRNGNFQNVEVTQLVTSYRY